MREWGSGSGGGRRSGSAERECRANRAACSRWEEASLARSLPAASCSCFLVLALFTEDSLTVALTVTDSNTIQVMVFFGVTGTGETVGIHVYPPNFRMKTDEYVRLLTEEVFPELRR